jgi:hypothetical protein
MQLFKTVLSEDNKCVTPKASSMESSHIQEIWKALGYRSGISKSYI